MPTRIGTPLKNPRTLAGNIPGTVLAAMLLLPVFGATAAQAQSSHSQVVYLPDPTPREKDLRLIYGDDPAAAARAAETLAARNARRQELVAWAANELVLLSTRMKLDVSKPKTKSSMAAAADNAEKIETVARNLQAALQAH